MHVTTPKLRLIAVDALTLVAGEEARARASLNVVTSRVSGADHAAVVKAEIEVTQGLELAVKGLGHLAVDSKARAHGTTNDVARLSSDAQS
jgi:hypothetical protein